MNKISSVSPQFKARTIINNPDKLLLKSDVAHLEKIGERIGLGCDTINFSIRKMKDSVKIAYDARFTNPNSELKINNIKDAPLEANHFAFIRETLNYIKNLYSSTIGG